MDSRYRRTNRFDGQSPSRAPDLGLSQGWTNTNTYRANTGVRSCSPEHERTRTRIFQKLLNTTEHELGKIINYRTWTNTNTKLIVGEHRTHDRTPNTGSNIEYITHTKCDAYSRSIKYVFAPVRRVRRLEKTVRTFRCSNWVQSPLFAQIYSWNSNCSHCSLFTMLDLFSLFVIFN